MIGGGPSAEGERGGEGWGGEGREGERRRAGEVGKKLHRQSHRVSAGITALHLRHYAPPCTQDNIQGGRAG